MAIHGLTNQSFNSFYVAIFHKGGKKPEQGYGFGKDLNNFFRVELKDPNLKYQLLDFGIKKLPSSLKTEEGDVQTNADNNDYYNDSFNIFLATDDLEKTFSTSMQLWDKTGLIHECDRTSIYQERDNYEDIYGHNRVRMKKCDHPCPVADQPVQIPCPKGCKASGTLIFYLASFLDHGCFRECKLTVTSIYDIQSITYNSLAKIKSEFGCFRKAPTGFPGYRGMIPLILKRTKINIKRPVLDKTKKVKQGGKEVAQRTGKKTDGTMWAVALEVHPDWAKSYYAWLQCQNIIKLGYSPNSDLIEQLPGVRALPELPQLESTTIRDLPDSDTVEVVLGDEEFKAIADIFANEKQHPEWQNKEQFAQALKQIYGVPVKKIPLSEFDNIKNYLLLKQF